MDRIEQAFRLLPDTAIITDVYWYILDFNRSEPFRNLRKGASLTRYMPDCRTIKEDKYPCGDRIWQRTATPVHENGVHVGYVVYLTDITESERLIKQRRQKSMELKAMTARQKKANEELEAYVHQAEALKQYEEQLRIARSIHDDAGHAITALHTISQMCLQIRDSDPDRYQGLIEEGLRICSQAEKTQGDKAWTSLTDMLETLTATSPFPVSLVISGREPDFVRENGLYEVISAVCKEAYHNTLDHSLADRLTLEVSMAPDRLTLHIFDNGCFHGRLEKGFGLNSMEENIRSSGGTVSFESEQGKGFGILAEWRDENV